MYGLGEGSQFKSEMKENRKEIFGDIAQSEKLPVSLLPEKTLLSSDGEIWQKTDKRKKQNPKTEGGKKGKAPCKKSELGYCNVVQKSQKWSSIL